MTPLNVYQCDTLAGMTNQNPTLTQLTQAHTNASKLIDIARYEVTHLEHLACWQARDEGVSVRETARLLGISASAVQRHLKGSCSEYRKAPMPVRGDKETYFSVQAQMWEHAPQFAETVCPFEWSAHERGFMVSRKMYAIYPPR